MRKRRPLRRDEWTIANTFEPARHEPARHEPATFGEIVYHDDRLRELNASGLAPFQVEGAEWIAPRARAALCDEQGTGKTVQLLRANMGRPMIVVCPPILRYAWREEAHKWMRGTRVILAPAGEIVIPRADELVIQSYESLPELGEIERLRPFLARVRILFDEAHKAKTEDADRTLRARALAACSRLVWIATGTPSGGPPEELWNVLELAGLASEAFGSWARFVAAHGGERAHAGQPYEWPAVPPEAAWIAERLRSVMLRRLRADVLPELPAKTYNVVRLPVPLELVETLGRTQRAWKEIGFHRVPGFDLFHEVQHALAVARIPAVREYVAAAGDHSLVLFSTFIEVVRAFERAPGWATITGEGATVCTREGKFTHHRAERGRARVIERFQKGEIDHLALSSGVGGTGLTLTRSSHLLRVSRYFNPTENEQTEDRIARIGQTAQQIQITDFVTDHPIEDRLFEICASKRERIDATINAAAVR